MFRLHFVILTSFLFALHSVSAAEIRLKNEPIHCPQTLVALGDVATLVGSAAETEMLRQIVLCTAPTDGETLTLDRTELRTLLSQLGIASSKHQITGAEQMTLVADERPKSMAPSSFVVQELPRPAKNNRVSHPSSSPASSVVAASYTYSKTDENRNFITQPFVRSSNPLRKDNLHPQFLETLEKQVAEAVNVYLSSRDTEKTLWNVNVRLTQEQAQLLASSGQIEDINEQENTTAPNALRNSPLRTFTLQMQKRDAQGQPVCVPVEAEVGILLQAVVLKRPLPKGSIISENDLVLKAVDKVPNNREDFFTDIKDVAGLETTGSLRDNSILSAAAVRRATLIRKGDAVTVRVQNNGIFVRTEGTALQDGTLGDMISIETIPYKNPTVRGRQAKQETSVFLARVCAAKTVEVSASPVSIGY